ncbi:MAG TPA: Do family serine endopeptidase [Saprospiraceae bacterium]|nr:Do family serine endopeptidase [Saprospiraceae bacterium]
MKNQFFWMSGSALAGACLALLGAGLMGWHTQAVQQSASNSLPAHYTGWSEGQGSSVVADFTGAAQAALPEVVHIQATMHRSGRQAGGMQPFDFQDLPAPFRHFFSIPQTPVPDSPQGNDEEAQGSGSGVILSADGFIVTNNHVVRDADELTVTLNDKRRFTAKVIGTDPSTDLAVVKIDAEGLPFMRFGNSDEVQIGQWVVAIGNPFNLSGTVTAGIVSAKGRDLHIVQDKAPVESFIQTDAVVNPGNSGGALINLQGELIGINTAIASPTGVYAGYAFAIPSNLVAKVVDDLRQFGVVQRGYLGITIRDNTPELAENSHHKFAPGVLVDSLVANSAAGAAGVHKGDLITHVDGQAVKSAPELLEIVGKHRPGDKLNISVLRDGDERTLSVMLKNRDGNTDRVTKQDHDEVLNALGAEFETLDAREAERMGIGGGVKVTRLGAGKIANQTDMHEGFVVVRVNNIAVRTAEELAAAIEKANGGVMLEGLYPGSSGTYYYAFGK